ncbi:MAG TPA: hypothetical protein VFF37_00495 [Streptomyces sp.]|nr:hypothetical protein [Streptomyces sp.]
MDIVRYLATIDLLRARELPRQRDRSVVGMEGPGYHLIDLAMSEGLRTDDDGSRRARTAEDFHDRGEELTGELNDRWGRQHHPWGMVTLRERIARGEEIPEPWAMLSVLVDELELWQPDGRGRWVAVGVADRDESDEIRLLAVVTDVDPV